MRSEIHLADSESRCSQSVGNHDGRSNEPGQRLANTRCPSVLLAARLLLFLHACSISLWKGSEEDGPFSSSINLCKQLPCNTEGVLDTRCCTCFPSHEIFGSQPRGTRGSLFSVLVAVPLSNSPLSLTLVDMLFNPLSESIPSS